MKNKKEFGQYFTPDNVAEYMISMSDVKKTAKILEPSCGNGVFIKLLEDKGYKNIIGYEVDKTIKPICTTNITFESFVSAKFTQKFDLIIGNPPYIRWKNLNRELKNELESNELWLRNFNKLCDYLYFFILKSVELLEVGGELIFITPEYWINTKHSQSLRNYLVSNGIFKEIIHFNETPIFEDVKSSIIIFKYIKLNAKFIVESKIEISKYYSTKKIDFGELRSKRENKIDEKLEKFFIKQFNLNEQWILAPDNIQKELNKYELSCQKTNINYKDKNDFSYLNLGSLVEIGNGMVSGLDKAFQIPNTLKLNEVEEESIIRVVKAKNMEQYTYSESSKYIFLNNESIDEDTLKIRFPNFYERLNFNIIELKNRYSYNKEIKYWDWVFLRNYKLFSNSEEKIFVPCKERISNKSRFRFSYVSGKIFPTQDVTALILKKETRESIFYILALLNSKYVFEWVKYKGVIKGNIVEFSEKPLNSIPIRIINWENKIEVEIHNSIVDLSKKYIQDRQQETLISIDEKIAQLF